MYLDFLFERFRKNAMGEAIIWDEKSFSYNDLLSLIDAAIIKLDASRLKSSSVVSLEADFSPNAIAYFLALIARGCVVVPLTPAVEAKKMEFKSIAEVEYCLSIDASDRCTISPTGLESKHELICKVKEKSHPALILFSSGSTGKSKAAIHDFVPLLEKFKLVRKKKRTISFLLFDHIGGVNTLLYVLSNAGTLVTVRDRSPDYIAGIISKFKVQILPTSPTFLNLFLMSNAYDGRDLSSLELITYGTEPMPETTLNRMRQVLPSCELLQTYGLSELGILRSKSKSSDSLWVKIGGEGFETRVSKGMLEIKAQSAMLGYLNAPNPFTTDGWFITGDAVEQDGEYLKILGRKSEIINVGGEKVYPAEVESLLQLMEGVVDVTVRGEPNSITGQMVSAYVRLSTGEKVGDFRKRLRQFCAEKMPLYKIPQKVVLMADELHNERFKKIRNMQIDV
jgi:acyl-coenzyme A synthetase/AMP-(fatty) acid ligase